MRPTLIAAPFWVLTGSQVSEVQPLNSFLGSLSGLGNIVAVRLQPSSSYPSEHLILHGQLFSLRRMTSSVMVPSPQLVEVILLLLHQEVDTVQSYTAVVAYDTAAAVGIRKAGDDLIVTSLASFQECKHQIRPGCGCWQYSVKILCSSGAGLIAIVLASFLRHLDTAVGHEGSL